MARFTLVYRPGHPKANKRGFVDTRDLGTWTNGDKQVMTMTDFWMDGARSQDGHDIGSRRKRSEFMRRRDLIDANDISPKYVEGVRRDEARSHERQRREDVARVVYQRFKP